MVEWIASNAALSEWMHARPPAATVALDTEFMRTDTFFARLALVQVNIDGHTALLDAPQLDRHPALAAYLGNPHSLCVMHSASEDLEVLLPVLPNGPARLFDTQIAAALTGYGAGMSYQKLVAALLGVELNKAETRSDWLQRPLSAGQFEYAALDVAYLPQIQVLLAEKLAALGRGEWLAQDCRALIERMCNATIDAQPQRSFRGAAEWPREQQAMLRRVLLWRDRMARTLDKPRPWLLDDAHALNLAANVPQDAETLFQRTKGLRALRTAQRSELLTLLHTPLSVDDLDIAPITPSIDTQQKRALAAMKIETARIATELDVPEGFLCPRRHLEALLADGAWPVALEGWRKEMLHDALIRLMPDRSAAA